MSPKNHLSAKQVWVVAIVVVGVMGIYGIVGSLTLKEGPKEEDHIGTIDLVDTLKDHPLKNTFSMLLGKSYLGDMDIGACRFGNTGSTCYKVSAKVLHYKEDGDGLFVLAIGFKDGNYNTFFIPGSVGRDFPAYDDQKGDSWVFSTSTPF